MDSIIYASATALARAIQRKEVSALEVVDAHLARIAAVNPRLNAIVTLTAERARAEAREADEALARGEVNGPLHGVPMTLKDNLETADVLSTGGTQGRAAFIPKHDATVVKRMRNAGAILLGKTNTPELTLSFETDNLLFGRTSNPYDLARSSGGSSGGAAAIIAAGGSPLDLGSDTGGSIRVPSHMCGTAGIRPTSGRVPRTGHIIPPGGVLDAFTQIGPMARFVEDLVTTLPIVAGVDWRDPAIVPMPLGDPSGVNLKSLRIAVYSDNGIRTPTPDIVATVRAAAAALSDLGNQVQEDRPAVMVQTNELYGASPKQTGVGACKRSWMNMARASRSLGWRSGSQRCVLTQNPRRKLVPSSFAGISFAARCCRLWRSTTPSSARRARSSRCRMASRTCPVPMADLPIPSRLT